jgi:lipopolysaccharide transport system ATP-binding protein
MGAIILDGVGKAYRRYPSQRARLIEWTMPFLGRQSTEIRVLRDISFNVRPGEAVGIIGTNGAGKSTLLKLIAGITHPTEGTITVDGRLAAMLELGLGFHPEFTGRQNAIMATKLLGFSAEEAENLLPGIIEFAELKEYIELPMRVYSTGMQMRLGFAIATAVRPDILIVDEALAVGDAYFQQKSFERIREFRERGTTLLIVSHDKAAIQSICSRAILIDKGTVARDGDPESVFNYYNALISVSEDKIAARNETTWQTASGSYDATIESSVLMDRSGQEKATFDVGETADLVVSVTIHKPIANLCVGFEIKDRLGQTMFGTNSAYHHKMVNNLKPGNLVRVSASIPLNLGQGSYSISIALAGSETHIDSNYHWVDKANMFEIVNASRPYFIGTAALDTRFECEVTV